MEAMKRSAENGFSRISSAPNRLASASHGAAGKAPPPETTRIALFLERLAPITGLLKSVAALLQMRAEKFSKVGIIVYD
jgi:hypothetical protein